MIVFDLRCSEQHTFEAWFRDRKAFEEQKAKGLISCPLCGSHQVEKVLSPVAIKRTTAPKSDANISEENELRQGVMKVMEKIYETVVKNTEDVGTSFAAEALKMHYGATEPRNIRGVATEDEEKILKDEGIEFAKIPVPAKAVKKEGTH